MRQRQPCAKRCASLHLKSLEPTRVGNPTFPNGFGRVDPRFQLPCIAPASAAQSKQKLSLAGIGHTSGPKVPQQTFGGSIQRAVKFEKSAVRSRIGPDCCRALKPSSRPEAGRRACFCFFPVVFKPKSGPEGRSTVQNRDRPSTGNGR